MTLTEHHTDTGWRWRWTHTPGVERELEFVHGRERWMQRTRIDAGGWSSAQQVDLPLPFGEDDAERLAAEHAGTPARTSSS